MIVSRDISRTLQNGILIFVLIHCLSCEKDWRRVTSANGLYSIDCPDGWEPEMTGDGRVWSVSPPDSKGEINLSGYAVASKDFSREEAEKTLDMFIEGRSFKLISPRKHVEIKGVKQLQSEYSLSDRIWRISIYWSEDAFCVASINDTKEGWDENRKTYERVLESVKVGREVGR